MNPYDRAHELARELAKTAEYRALLQAKEAIKADAAATRMMNDFERKQRAVYQLYQSGEPPQPSQMQELQALMEIMQQNSILREYVQAEMRLGQLVNDIQKILSDALNGVRWELDEEIE